ncbi:hypothetical protein [Antribacter gilvus]|uniref:hypothetical protein n=1 Tax=Antribacter gilvus TaxID=2304675 RepID=UPI0013DE9D71|nr:hypothetical protein [Antribacter gilvus]
MKIKQMLTSNAHTCGGYVPPAADAVRAFRARVRGGALSIPAPDSVPGVHPV